MRARLPRCVLARRLSRCAAYFTARKDTDALAPIAEIATAEPAPSAPAPSVIDPLLVMNGPVFDAVCVMLGTTVRAGLAESAMLATEKDAPAPVALIATELPSPVTVPDAMIEPEFWTGPVLVECWMTGPNPYPPTMGGPAIVAGGPLLMLTSEIAAIEPVELARTEAPAPPMLPTLMPGPAALPALPLLTTVWVMSLKAVADQVVVLTKENETEAAAPVAATETEAPFPLTSPTDTAGTGPGLNKVFVTLPPVPTLIPLLMFCMMVPKFGLVNVSSLSAVTDTAP